MQKRKFIDGIVVKAHFYEEKSSSYSSYGYSSSYDDAMCPPMIFRLRGDATVAEVRRAVDRFCEAMYKEGCEGMAGRAEMELHKVSARSEAANDTFCGEKAVLNTFSSSQPQAHSTGRFNHNAYGKQSWKFPGRDAEAKQDAGADEATCVADLVQDDTVQLKFTWRLEDLSKLDARKLKPQDLPVSGQGVACASLQLVDCIRKYSQREQLDQTESWYCNKCKDHVRAFKELAIWKAPPILIIQLKRFVFKKNGFREKIDTHIDFPLEGLDMSEFICSPTGSQNAVYDCYAVSNHFGGLGGGHYTAHALNGGEWCSFDDSRVTTNVEPSTVITSSAYCLYYKLRDWKADLGGLEGASNGAGGNGSGDDSSEGGAVSREMDNFKLDEKETGSDDMHIEVLKGGGGGRNGTTSNGFDITGRGAEPQSADGGYEGDDDLPTAPTSPSYDQAHEF